MKTNRETIIRISPDVNSQASLLELPGPEYSSHDDQGLGHVRSLILELAEKMDHQYLVIDLSHVHFFGASFIGTLVSAWDQLKKRQRNLAICGLTPFCARLIEVLHLDKLFDIYPTRGIALEKIGDHSNREAGQRTTGRIRIEESEVAWDQNMVRLEYVGDDGTPIRSEIVPRLEGKG